jgi:cell division protein FtsI (penicillin-binding protein 3)
MSKKEKSRGRKASAGETWLRLRMGLILFIYLAFFVIIAVRITNLMVINGATLDSYAERQHNVISTHVTKRGNIYDVNGLNFAVSVEMCSICASPDKVKNPGKTANLLSAILSMDKKFVFKKLTEKKNFVWIKRMVSPYTADRIRELQLEGIGFVKEDKRFYPHRTLASHIVGFAGIDSQGLSGIEQELDDDLKSKRSHFIAIRDASGKRLLGTDISENDALKNCDVTLTIDVWAQHIAERELMAAVERSGARGGSAIVMDPASGDILAMASLPEFDPNIYGKYPESYRRNKAVSMTFEPGSTFKIFLVSGILEDELAAEEDTFYCEGGEYQVFNTMFHDHGGDFGMLSVSDIITYSSNIGAIKLGIELGKSRYSDYISIFGFGKRTGIKLPGEERGRLPSVSSMNEVDLAALSFGQGLSVTPIQLISAAAAIANGGFLMKPHVVKEIKRSDGRIVYAAKPEVVRRVMGDRTAGMVKEMMVRVVESGTGGEAKVPGFSVGGKTGTAQIFDPDTGKYSEGEFIASFVGFVPAENPRLVILVVVDRPKNGIYGGSVAAPAFSKIAGDTMKYLKIYPEDMYLKGDEIRAKEGADVSPLM